MHRFTAILIAASTLAAGAAPALAEGPITTTRADDGRYCVRSVDPSADVPTIATARVGACRTEKDWGRRGVVIDAPARIAAVAKVRGEELAAR